MTVLTFKGSYQRQRIRDALDLWEAGTCLFFEEVANNQNLNETTLVFVGLLPV